jgi:N-acetylglucosaminyldiphosphoundecaprenol N-acetyl-beta-D-mannosaminyltransferase
MQRARLFGMDVDVVRIREAVDQIESWIHVPDGRLHYVVTPNVQHALLYQQHAQFREAYEHASLVLIDGFPLVWSGRLLGTPVPERVAGSDLVPAVLARARRDHGFSIFLLGAAPGVGERAAAAIREKHPHVRVAGTLSPPFGFEHDENQNRNILERISDAAPDVLVVGLGAPKQELWVSRFREQLKVPVALCAGASIDFLAGEKSRAPRWMQQTGLEWIHRVATEPARLAPRYARDAMRFPGLLFREWRQRRGSP